MFIRSQAQSPCHFRSRFAWGVFKPETAMVRGEMMLGLAGAMRTIVSTVEICAPTGWI